MNPETLYPELKEMKSSEIFIEWAYIVKGFGLVEKIHVRRVIPKKQQGIFIKALKEQYGIQQDKSYFDDPEAGKLFECVNLVTIER
jgi:hypothetical protein